jgi:hypothetical protein
LPSREGLGTRQDAKILDRPLSERGSARLRDGRFSRFEPWPEEARRLGRRFHAGGQGSAKCNGNYAAARAGAGRAAGHRAALAVGFLVILPRELPPDDGTLGRAEHNAAPGGEHCGVGARDVKERMAAWSSRPQTMTRAMQSLSLRSQFISFDAPRQSPGISHRLHAASQCGPSARLPNHLIPVG